MKRGIVCLVILIILSAPVWAAGEQASGAQSSLSAVAAVSDGPVTLRFAWWGAEARHNATLQNLAAYEKLNPHVRFEPEYGAIGGFLEKLYVQLNSKTAPDLPQVDGKWVPDMMRNYRDSFRDLRELSVDLSGFDQGFLGKICGDENFILGASMGSNNFGCIYNAEFFAKFGLGDPTNWSWEDYLEAGRKVQAQDTESHLIYNLLTQNSEHFKWRIKQITGKDLVGNDNKVQFTDADAEKAFQYIYDLIQSGTLPPFEESIPYATSFPHEVPKWLQGKYGMHFTSISTLSGIVNGSPFEIKTAKLPVYKDAKDIGWPISSSQAIGVYAYGKNQEEAAKFLNWYINDEQAVKTTSDTRGFPSNLRATKLLGDNNMLMPQMVQSAQNYATQGSSAENSATIDPKILELIAEFAQQVGYRRMTPKQAAGAFRIELQNYLDTTRK